MRRPISLYINSQGFRRTTDRNIILAPARFGGLDIIDFHVYYTTQKIKWMLHHLNENDQTGKLYKILIQNHQLEMGLSTTIFNLKWDQNHFLSTDSSVKNTWQSLSKLNTTLHIKNINIVKVKTIMDKIIKKLQKKS